MSDFEDPSLLGRAGVSARRHDEHLKAGCATLSRPLNWCAVRTLQQLWTWNF